jgi:hypothetical protein
MRRSRVSLDHTQHAAIGKVIERLQSDLAAARSHSLGRDRRVGQVMCYLSLMRSAGLIAKTAAVTCTKAIRQHYTSSRAEGKQAAHYLPGQLRINGQCPWEFIPDWRSAQALEGLFGDVEDLPADFNKADSAAEAYQSVEGLAQSFARSCELVVRDPQPLEGNRINRVLVRRAYNDWIMHSRHAYREAVARQETRVNVPPLEVGANRELDPSNIQARGEAMHRDRHYIDRTEFLKQYLATARAENLSDFLMNELEQQFHA